MAAQGPHPESEVSTLVSHFLQAEQAFDAAALDKLISPQYEGISPAGEVDPHDRFLSFYMADKKIPWPTTTIEDEHTRIFGDTAVDTMKFIYTIPGPDKTTHRLEIRGRFVRQRQGGV